MPAKIKEVEIININNELVNDKCTHRYKSGFVNIGGFQMPNHFTKLSPKIFDMEVHDSDIWITSYPKNGTTWTQEMVWLIANNLDYETAKNTALDERFPFLEYSGLTDYEKMLAENDVTIPKYVAKSFEVATEQTQPRFIKTHLPWNLLPEQIQNGTKKPKIIHVIRNPKDVCVSYYHHSRLISGFKGTFEEYFKLFVEDKVMYSPFWKNISSYWEHRDQPNILFLKYEDMKENLPKAIRTVANFLGKNISDADVESLSNHLSFDNMKKNESVNKDEVVNALRKLKIVSEDGNFMRSGNVGGYKVAMSDEMEKIFDKWSQDNIGELKNLYKLGTK